MSYNYNSNTKALRGCVYEILLQSRIFCQESLMSVKVAKVLQAERTGRMPWATHVLASCPGPTRLYPQYNGILASLAY